MKRNVTVKTLIWQSNGGVLLQYEILCWYHVNKYRALSGSQGVLIPEQKAHWYHANTL